MTKTMKTGIIAALTVVLIAVCCLFVGTLNKSAYAASQEQIEAFENHVKTNLAKEDDSMYTEDLFAESGYVLAFKRAKSLYVEGASEEVMAVYNKVLEIFREPLELESFATSTLYFRIHKMNGNELLYTQNEELQGYEAIYNKYTDGSHTAVADYLNGVLGLTDNLTEARTQMNAIGEKIAAAVAAIDRIQYYNSDTQEMQIYSEEAGAALYIVADSADSIGYKFTEAGGALDETIENSATAALFDIYGKDFTALTAEQETVSNYAFYAAAVEALRAQYDKAIAVMTEIADLSDIINDDVCYTESGKVKAARSAYGALSEYNAMDSVSANNFNDLQSLVSNIANLEAIEARIAEIETAIQNTIDAISAIGDVAYTAESNGKIQAAEALFENLDKDIKDNDTAEGQDLIVTNYATLVAARAAYDKMHEQVETAVSAIVGLSVFETEGDLYGEFLKVQGLYTALDAEQKTAVDETVPQDTDKTCRELYAYYQAKANAIWAKVDPVVTAIKNLGDVTISVEFTERLNAARKAYDALSDQEKLAVSNYSELQAKEAAFKVLMDVATQWVEAVAAIEDPVTIENMGLVETAKEFFESFEQNVQDVLKQSNEYKDSYEKYADAVEQYTALLNKISGLAGKMADLPTAEISLDEAFEQNLLDFDQAVTPVVDEYTALTENEQAYLRENYAEQYANYLAATENYAQYHVEYLIVKIGSVEKITLAQAAAISEARDAYDALDESLQTKVRNYENKEGAETLLDPTLVAAETKLKEFTVAYDAWIDEVNKFVPEGTAVADLISVSFEKVNGLKEEYEAFLQEVEEDPDATAAVTDYLKEGKAMLDEVEAKAKDLITALTEELNEIVAVPEGERYTAEFMLRLENAEKKYGELDDTQKDIAYDDENSIIAALNSAYESFKNVYVMQVLVTDYTASVDALYKNVVTDEIYTVDVEVMLNTLKAVYNGMPAYRAVLADAYAKLGEVETAFNAAKEEGKVLDLKNVSSDIAVKNEEVNDRIDQVVEDLTKAYADADAALKQQIEGTFNAAIEGLEQAYKNADTALKNSIAENLSKIEKATQDIAALKTELEGKIAAAKEALEAADAELRDDLNAALAEIEQLAKDYADADAALRTEILNKINEKAQELTTKYSRADADLKAELQAEIAKAVADAVKTLTDGYQAADKALKDQIEATIDELEEALIADIAELEESFTAAKTAIEAAIKAEEDARKQADADLQAQLDAALKRIEELEANKASKWLGIIALLVGIFGTVGAVWFIIDKFAGKKN